MANDAPKAATPAVLEHPVYPYPFPGPPPPGTYPPPLFTYPPPADPANPNATGAAPPSGTPYVFPCPPPPGMFFPFPPAGLVPAPQPKPQPAPPSSSSRKKRNQVKMACTNCAQACKRCEDTRPCARCVKYSLSETCVDGQRKERKRGVKRGPYKRRARGSDSPPAADSVTDTPAAEGTGSPPGQWTAAHGPPPAPAGAPTPVPLPAPPEGYPHPFYPPMGFVLMPPPPGAEEGAPPVPYFYPYPPFGMYTPPPQPQPAATQNGAEKKANGAAGESDTKDGEGEADAEGDVEGMLSA